MLELIRPTKAGSWPESRLGVGGVAEVVFEAENTHIQNGNLRLYHQ